MTEIVRQVMNATSEKILTAGLDAMAKCCEALTEQNKQLNLDIDGLKNKIRNLENKLLISVHIRRTDFLEIDT